MIGSPKQIAWIEKIIASKDEYAKQQDENRKFMPEITWSFDDWVKARDLINEKVNRANAWIDYIKDVKVDVLVLVPRIQALGELKGTEKQITFAESLRICKCLYALDIIYNSVMKQYFNARVEEAFDYFKTLSNDAKFWIETSEGTIFAELTKLHQAKVDAKKAEEKKAFDNLSDEEKNKIKEEKLRAKGYTDEEIVKIKKIDESLKIINEKRVQKTNSKAEIHYDQLVWGLKTKNIDLCLAEIPLILEYLEKDEEE